jgi:hypothetical protein
MHTGDVMRRMLAAYEAGDRILTCAWCERVELDGEWVLAPRAALSADRRAIHAVTLDLPSVRRRGSIDI